MLPNSHNEVWPPRRFRDYFSWLDRWDRLWAPPSSDQGMSAGATLAKFAASLLFGTPPIFRVPSATDQDAAERAMTAVLAAPENLSALVTAAEYQAAYGGVYLRLDWNLSVLDHVLIQPIPPRSVVPQFTMGRLRSMISWSELPNPDEGYAVKESHWRLLEERTKDHIEYGLYVGSGRNLGARMPLDLHPDTTDLAELVDAHDQIPIPEELSGLTFAYIPNRLPAPQFGSLGMPLGRSDFAGAEQILKNIDIVAADRMREFRVARARAVVPASMTQTGELGEGSQFDMDREFFISVPSLTGPDGAPSSVEMIQPKIRSAEYAQTLELLRRELWITAGYSPASFGTVDGGEQTAAGVAQRERMSAFTRSTKQRHCSAFAPLATVALELNALIYGTPMPGGNVTITWPKIDRDPLATAQTISLLTGGGSISISLEQRVRTLHPDWTDPQIQQEIDLIRQQA